MSKDPIGDIVKEWEKKTPDELSPAHWTVIRIDGHCFHTFTKPFDKPCDLVLQEAMVATTKDLCQEFQALTGYTQSDEITLLLPPTAVDPKTGQHKPLIFRGRRQKLESLTAGFASARFNFHLLQQQQQPTTPAKVASMRSGRAYFDSRVISVPTIDNAALIFRWRYEVDCFKNGIGSLAHTKFSSKQLHGKSTRSQMCMLDGLGIDIFRDFPASLFYGTFVKRQALEKMLPNWKTKELEPCLRHEYVGFSIPSRPFPVNFLQLLQEKDVDLQKFLGSK